MLQDKKYIDNLQEIIQAKLEENKISIKELERKAGLKVSAVQNILSGRSSNPGIETLIAISKTLNCSLDELLGETSSQSISNNSINNLEHQDREVKVAWDYRLYQECAEKLENYIKDKHPKSTSLANTELILFLIKEAYVYSLEGGSNKADLRFIKWIVDSHSQTNKSN